MLSSEEIMGKRSGRLLLNLPNSIPWFSLPHILNKIIQYFISNQTVTNPDQIIMQTDHGYKFNRLFPTSISDFPEYTMKRSYTRPTADVPITSSSRVSVNHGKQNLLSFVTIPQFTIYRLSTKYQCCKGVSPYPP